MTAPTHPTDLQLPGDEVFLSPPSFAQERLWFLQQLEGTGSAAYNVGVGFRLTGRYDHAALEHALSELVRRHETLRTTLVTRDDELTQAIAPPHPVRLAVEDLSAAADPQAAVRERADRELGARFDAGTGPVYRTALLRTAPDEHVLLLVLDHLVCDAWSLRVLHRDVVGCYAAAATGSPPPPDPPVQYADYAAWQRDWMASGELLRQVGYWREQLADPPAKVRPPLPAGGTPAAAPGSFEQELPPALAEALAARGRQHNASLFMVVTAAFAALLQRYSGQQDLVVGTLLANRGQAETEQLVGFFTNTAALRFDLSGRPTVAQLIGRSRDTALGAYAHQDLPFHRLVEELRPVRGSGELPYFDVMIQLADVDREPAEVDGVRIEPVPLDSRPAPMDLVVSLLKQDGRHTLVWDHHGGRVDAPAAARMRQHFARLLDAFAAGADGPVEELQLFDPDEPHGWPGADPARPAPERVVPEPAEPEPAEPEQRRTAPSGPWQSLVAAVWCEVLGYEPDEVSADDDFFELGGHSLAAGRVVSRLNRRGCSGLPVRSIFDFPVLADLASAAADHADTPRG